MEVYTLSEQANASIPQDIRAQFQTDEKGRVLFFTAPPLNVAQPLTKDGTALGHSAAYLAARARREQAKAEKRSAVAAGATQREDAAKKARLDEEQRLGAAVAQLGARAVRALGDQLAATTRLELDALFDAHAPDVAQQMVQELVQRQARAAKTALQREVNELKWEAGKRSSVSGMTARLEEKI